MVQEPDEEIDDAEDDENDEEDDVAAPVAAFGGLRIRSKYNKSFTAKMMLSEENVKQYYCEVVNRLLSYKKATYRVYWRQASVRAGMKTLAKFAIRGKTLYMYLALDPQQYVGTKYAAKDMSQVKKYASVPVRVKIKSPRSVKFANELVEKLAEEYALVPAKMRKVTLSADDFPYDTVENLAEKGLVKINPDAE